MSQDKAMFPCGAHLAALVQEDSMTGELRIPMPFKGDDVLILRWTQVKGFFISDEFAHKWGPHLKHTLDGAHYLGTFMLNDELVVLDKVAWQSDAEGLSECRFNADGDDTAGSYQGFNGSAALNVSSLVTSLTPQRAEALAKARRLNVEHQGRSLELSWIAKSDEVWALELRHHEHQELPSPVEVDSIETFYLNIYTPQLCWEHKYMPTDL